MIASANRSNTRFGLLAGLFIGVAAISFFTENYLLLAVPFAALIFYEGWQKKETVFYLLLFTLPFSFEYHFSSTLATDVPDEALMLLVTGLSIAYWLYHPAALSKKILLHPLLLPLIFLIVWVFIAVIFSTHPLVSVKFLLAKTWYMGAFVLAPFLLFREKKAIIIAAGSLAAAMMMVAVISLLRHREHGFSFATINDAVFPFFRNHVNYSAMLVCMIPVLLAFFAWARTANQKLTVAIFVIVALGALFFSYSRGAWLAFLIGLATYWLIKRKLILTAYVAAALFAIAALFWLKNNDRYLKYAPDFETTIFHKNFGKHLIATYKLKDVSTEERFYRWIAGVRMIKDSWLTGYGPNTFYDNYKEYAVPAFKTWVSDNKEHSTVHNYFLLTAIEQGLPGLLLLLILFGVMLYYSQRLYHRVQDPFYKTVALTAGVITTMIIVVNFLSDLIETDKVGSIFFLCLGILIATDVNTKSDNSFNQSNPGSDSSPDIQGVS